MALPAGREASSGWTFQRVPKAGHGAELGVRGTRSVPRPLLRARINPLAPKQMEQILGALPDPDFTGFPPTLGRGRAGHCSRASSQRTAPGGFPAPPNHSHIPLLGALPWCPSLGHTRIQVLYPQQPPASRNICRPQLIPAAFHPKKGPRGTAALQFPGITTLEQPHQEQGSSTTGRRRISTWSCSGREEKNWDFFLLVFRLPTDKSMQGSESCRNGP